MIAFILKYKEHMYYQSLSDTDSITFGSDKKDTVYVSDLTGGQITVSVKDEKLSVQTKPPFSFSEKNLGIGVLHHIDKDSKTLIYASRATGASSQVFRLPLNGLIRLGRSAANDISIGLPFVSGKHLLFRIQDGNVRVEDLDSSNGVYLNGQRIKAAILRSGDTISIFTVLIKMVNHTLQFENVGSSLQFAAPTDHDAETTTKNLSLSFRLSPRIQNQLPQEPIILDRPPRKGQEYHPSGNRIASMISMGAMAGASLAMGIASPALAFARAASMAVGVFNMASANKMDKKRQAEMEEYNRRRDEEYRTYIEAQRARIMLTAQEQQSIITEENPEPEKCLAMLEKMDRRIWERRSCDRDFLDVRIGMSYEELCVPIKNYAENRGLMMDDDELEELCNSIAEENRLVDYIPMRLPLRKVPTIGVFGDRDKTVHLIRNMIVSMTALHPAKDVQLVGIFDNSERKRWASLRWLPHIWDKSGQFRYMAFDRERAHQLCEMLYDVLNRRRENRKDDHSGKQAAPTPHYVVILGSRDLIEHEPIMDLLSSEAENLGVSTFFLFDELYYMPRDCGCFIDLTQEFPYIYDRYHANKRVAFSRDTSVSSSKFSEFARKMAAIELDDNSVVNSLPSSITFLEGMGVKSIEQLHITQRWGENQVCESLRTPIGVLPTGKTYYLDIHYKAHGAHGLLAGTTGSGKSELLRTWILSMAVNYHPHEVNFVIIDYKGGGMANKLEALPHVVGKITNIDTNISRSLVSLKREAKRRMIMLEKIPGVDDVDQYMHLYYAGKVTEPMPHLIIVSDEFAELKKEEPEFMKELSSLARVGRSVGIHLILATQRPSGVVDDQIDSNARFRICMKVNSVQDSKEMIKRPDAAGITQRGRAYVRIGEDEEFSLIQSYWSGAEYSGGNENPFSDQVRIVDVSGERIQRKEAPSEERGMVGSDQLTLIVSHISEVTERNGISRLSGPWMPPLPEMLHIDELGATPCFNGTEWVNTSVQLCVPIGIYDRPALQEQGIQYLDFSQTPHYGIYGAPLSGKTTFLKTLILSLGLYFTPENVNINILDFGGGSLGMFEAMPHVANIIKEGETEKLQRFMEWVTKEIQTRKICFQKEKVANFQQYAMKKSNLPAIFLIIDNQLRLSTLVNEMDQFLINLSMTGSDCGIHIVFTSNNVNKTSMNLQANIGGNIALHLADRNDYRSVVSEFPEGCGMPGNPGRGLIRDSVAAEFQTAIFMPSENEAESTEKLEELIGHMRSSWKGDEAASVQSMPDVVTGEEIAEFYGVNDLLPVGLDYENYQPVYIDLRKKHTLLVSSFEDTQGVQVMRSLANLLLTKRDNRLYILDGRMTLESMKNKAAMYGSDSAAMNRIVQTIAKEMEHREDMIFSQHDDQDENGGMAYKSMICIMIDQMHKVMELLDEENRDLLVQICQNTEELGFIAIAHGTVEEIGKYMFTEELTITFVDNAEVSDFAQENWQKGVCVGGKVRKHNFFSQKMLSPSQISEEINDGDGMVFDCGTAVRVKLMGGAL